MKRIGEGAEAIISLDGKQVVKERIKKSYRLPEIDERLRRIRTRKEGKILEKLAAFGFTPKLLKSDDKNMTISMEHIAGRKVRDALNTRNCAKISTLIGEKVAELHNIGIIHSDLTTSNMILDKKGRLFLIDFGLSFESAKVEDKAVDLHLLRQALESKHHELWEKAFLAALKSYRANAKQASDVIKRLEIVESRGRNKSKGS